MVLSNKSLQYCNSDEKEIVVVTTEEVEYLLYKEEKAHCAQEL